MRGMSLGALALGFWGMIGFGAIAAGPAVLEPTLPDVAVRQTLEDRDYAAAGKAIAAALQAPGAPREEPLYLRGWALYLAQQYDAAVTAFDGFCQQFPQSAWLPRVRLAKAVALARHGAFRGAGALYRAEAERLLSPQRREQLAAIYLEFADASFHPPRADQLDPHYERALAFYQKAEPWIADPPRKLTVQLRIAECLVQLHKLDEARQLLAQVVAQQPALHEAAYAIVVHDGNDTFQGSFAVARETPIAVTIRAVDLEDRPLHLPVMLVRSRQVTQAGRGTWQPLDAAPIPAETAADGTLRLNWNFAQGGRYRLRAEARDGFQNPIDAEAEVEVSDADDPQRLRILADAHSLAASQSLPYMLLWRGAATPALVTVETSRILHAELVQLQPGRNPLSLALSDAMAPNARLAATVLANPGT